MTNVDRSMIAIGGQNEDNIDGLKTVEKLHNGIWSLQSSLIVNIYAHCTVQYNERKLLAVGGIQNGQV